jgi:hypothetical protein
MGRRRRKILQNKTKTQKTIVQKATEMQILNAENQLLNVNNEVSSVKSEIFVKSEAVFASEEKLEKKKPTGRPTHNASYVLTPHQVGLITAFLLTDGWLSMGPTYRNPSIGLQLAKRSYSLIEKFVTELQEVVTGTPLPREREAFSSGEKTFIQYQIRTVSHPQMHQFVKAFGGHGKNKTVPAVSYLMEVLNWETLAVIFMCDGSRKSAEGRGMELHFQGFKGYKPLGRFCIALYQKFGIKAFPSYYGESLSGEETQYHIQISAYSVDIIRDKLLPHMLPAFTYKIPTKEVTQIRDARVSPWRKWYHENKNAT